MYVFTGPVVIDYQPLEVTFPPSRLIASYAYGKTVWRDATGAWHDKYGPSADDLAGADRVYPGGRLNSVTDAQAAELAAAGYGAYLDPPLHAAIVDAAVVGVSVAG